MKDKIDHFKGFLDNHSLTNRKDSNKAQKINHEDHQGNRNIDNHQNVTVTKNSIFPRYKQHLAKYTSR